MTKEKIIEMAKECNLIGMRPHLDGIYFESLEAFAKLVAEREREACAKICDEHSGYMTGIVGLKIRARGQE
jgi:hypothetical protein